MSESEDWSHDEEEDCQHDTFVYGGRVVCRKCGLEIIEFKIEAEWMKGMKGSNSSHRIRHDSQKNKIDETLRKHGFDIAKSIADIVDQRYNLIATKVQRGDIRRSLIAACLWRVCKENGLSFTEEEIRKKLKISEKDYGDADSKYKTKIECNIQEDFRNLVQEYFMKIHLNPHYIPIFLKFHELVARGSQKVKRGAYTSVIPACIYLFIEHLKLKYPSKLNSELRAMTKEKLAEIYKINVLTIQTISESVNGSIIHS